jgi:hypothetical protein
VRPVGAEPSDRAFGPNPNRDDLDAAAGWGIVMRSIRTIADVVALTAAAGPPVEPADPAMRAAVERELGLAADEVTQRLGRERVARGAGAGRP